MTRTSTAALLASLLISLPGCATDGTTELAVDEGIAVSDKDTHAVLAEEVATQTRLSCGSTFSLEGGNRVATGVYVVSVYPEPTRGKVIKTFPEPADILAFIDANKDLLDLPAHTLGTYCEGTAGNDCRTLPSGTKPTCYLDISRETASLSDAAKLARACNQKSIALLAEDGVKIIDQEGGRPFGDGQGLQGPSLAPCAAVRAAP